jgi:hypothetical protein
VSSARNGLLNLSQMLLRFLNRLIIGFGILLGVGIFILLIPIAILIWPFSYLYDKKTEAEFRSFLAEKEGLELFVYTSRKNSQNYIENKILPNLPDKMVVVFLDGKTPRTRNLAEDRTSQILYRMKNIGFPTVIRIANSGIKNISLKKEFHNIRSQQRDHQEFVRIVNDAVLKLKGEREN